MVAVLKPGSPNTESGDDRSKDRYDAGKKAGAAAILNGPTHETLMLELQMLRIAVAALSEEAVKRERMVEHYRELAETYQEFCTDYRAMLEGK